MPDLAAVRDDLSGSRFDRCDVGRRGAGETELDLLTTPEITREFA